MKIAIFGAGRIGLAAEQMLKEEGYNKVAVFDMNEYGEDVFNDFDVFLCATPWHATKYIAESVAARKNKIYFDLTEDVEIGRMVREGSKSVMIPHCGLAPGAVSIIAASMLPAESVVMRVGAIPEHSDCGRLNYHLTWSTDGLVNEYNHPCPALRYGKLVYLDPLEDLTMLGKIGTAPPGTYEAFNTSGGIGTLAESLLGKSQNVMYQTIRYKGHQDYMQFLLNDLGFKERQEELVTLLDTTLPRGGPDKIVIDITANDYYVRDILGANGMSAIQRTTAAGVVAAMVWAMRKGLNHIDNSNKHLLREGNWIANEDIPREELQDIKCWTETYE